MSEILRYDVNEDLAHTGIINAGDFCIIVQVMWVGIKGLLFQADAIAYCGK